MNTAPPPMMRAQVQRFYAALRANDVSVVNDMLENDFPIQWAQAFSEHSLPEFAMRHGAVESAWLLMSKGVMPENWSGFTGDAWKAFLKKGWELATSQSNVNLSMETYLKIAKVGIKVTGERLPSWLDKAMSESSTAATRVTTSLMSGLSKLMSRVRESFDTPQETEENTGSTRPIFVAPVKMTPRASEEKPKSAPAKKPVKSKETDVTPMTSSRVVGHRAAKKPTVKAPTKAVKKTTKAKTVQKQGK